MAQIENNPTFVLSELMNEKQTRTKSLRIKKYKQIAERIWKCIEKWINKWIDE